MYLSKSSRTGTIFLIEIKSNKLLIKLKDNLGLEYLYPPDHSSFTWVSFWEELKYCEITQNAVKHQKNIVLVKTL